MCTSIYTPIHLSKVNNCSFLLCFCTGLSRMRRCSAHTKNTEFIPGERERKKAYRWKLPEGMESSLASVRAGVLFLCALFCYPFCSAHNRTKRRKWKINNRWRRGAMVSSVQVVITPTERRKNCFLVTIELNSPTKCSDREPQDFLCKFLHLHSNDFNDSDDAKAKKTLNIIWRKP